MTTAWACKRSASLQLCIPFWSRRVCIFGEIILFCSYQEFHQLNYTVAKKKKIQPQPNRVLVQVCAHSEALLIELTESLIPAFPVLCSLSCLFGWEYQLGQVILDNLPHRLLGLAACFCPWFLYSLLPFQCLNTYNTNLLESQSILWPQMFTSWYLWKVVHLDKGPYLLSPAVLTMHVNCF